MADAEDRTRLWLRLEGLALAALAVVLFAGTGASWWLFATLLLAPDLAMAGYLAGPRVGALAYNAAHTWIGPALLGGLGIALGAGLAVQIALIWAVHIGADRALGYGLKRPEGFGHTHLGPVGRRAA